MPRPRWQARGARAQAGRRRVHLHALRRPHHAALRRLPRRGHPDRRRAPRAGRRARGRRLGALQSRQDRRRRDHRRPGRHRRRDRHRERLARELARSSCSAARAPSRTCAAARSRRWTTSAWCGRSRSSPMPSTRPTAFPSTSSSRSATRSRAFRGPPTSRSRWTSSWARSRRARRRFPRIRTEPPRISPDRDEVRHAIELLERAKRPMLMAGTASSGRARALR